MTINVFVYGTLKPGEINFRRYCEGRIIEAKEAIARGQLYHLPFGYPAMVLAEGWVKGFVLSFSDPELLKQLDVLEDYDPQRTVMQNEYQRSQIETFNPENLHILGSAWVYSMHLEKILTYQGTFLPHGEWCSRQPE